MNNEKRRSAIIQQIVVLVHSVNFNCLTAEQAVMAGEG